MKLLFDENLSRRLVGRLGGLHPASANAAEVGLARASDEEIWRYAGENGFLVVTADANFINLEAMSGPPPKVVWLKGWRHPLRDA